MLGRGRLFAHAALASAVALVASASVPACAAQLSQKREEGRTGVPTSVRALGSFTPSISDSVGATVRAAGNPEMRTFRFTPSPKVGAGKALSLGVRGKAISVPDARRQAEEPAGYDMGVAVGARGVALTGSASKVDLGLAKRDSVTVGLGYAKRDWNAQLKLGQEREDLRGADRVGEEKRYSIELGGAYTLTRNLQLGAGMRYRVTPQPNANVHEREDERTAYVGVGVSF